MIRILAILVALIIAYVLSPKYLLAKKVECYTQYGPCPSYLAEGLDSFLATPLLRPLPSARAKAVLSAYPQIRSVALFRRLPSTLVVSVDLRRPIGQVLGTKSERSQFALVDESGIVFSQSTGSLALPLLTIPSPVELNTRLATTQVAAVQALHRLSLLGIGIPTGTIVNTDLLVEMQNGLHIVINLNRPIPQWYSSLQVILDRSKISSKFPKKIDMRFTNPVLTY